MGDESTGDGIMKPYYQDEAVTIYNADCRDVLPNLSEIAVTVTSPPYNTLGSRIPVNGTGKMTADGWMKKVGRIGYDDDMPEEDYEQWQQEIAGLIYAATVDGGSFFYNHKVRWRDRKMVHPLHLVESFPRWNVRQEIIWERNGGIAHNAKLFTPSDERVYWMLKGEMPRVWNLEGARNLSVWHMAAEYGTEHPCPFPVRLPRKCLSGVTQHGDTVLDPFCGIGTTLRAAKDFNLKSIGIEKDESFCEIAAKRMSQLVMEL